MAATHTPGPWQVGMKVHILDKNQTLIADVRDRYDGTGNNFSSSAEANARLIAAAPEMLDVLEALRRECDSDNLGTVKAPSWTTVCKAAAVIAKATGSAAC